jgi:hypothetical protein
MTTEHFFGRRLEPAAGVVLHGAGQSYDEFDAYWRNLKGREPCLYMAYVGLDHDTRPRLQTIRTELERYPEWVLPQIGLAMAHDGKPEKHYEQHVAAGLHDVHIEQFCEGLARLGRPAFVRLGYEFNGHWNGYQADTFKPAWIRVAEILRCHSLDVALVWCYAPDGNNKDYLSFYPGDAYVDWWGIDLFSPDSFSQADSLSFMQDARLRRYPVMIGESTPRRVGVQDGQKSWDRWFKPYFQFMHDHSHLKAFCYISWDWLKIGNPAWIDWGNGRIGDNADVLSLYRCELQKPRYRHAGPESDLRRALNLNPR